MRIDRLDLISYGHLRDRSLDLSSPRKGLVVVVGPNEAGKSTTMRALDALLFGIDRRNADHFGQGRSSLRIGARLTVSDGTSHEIVRQGLNAAPLVDAAGEPLAEAVMLEMIGHTDPALFRTLFRVDHDELSNGSAALLETDGEIGRLVFGASLGSVALTTVLRDLQTRADELFRPGAKKTLAHAALIEHRKFAKAARDARVKPKVWDDLDYRKRSTETLISSLAQRQRGLRSDDSRLGRITSALPLLTARARLSEQLEEVAATGPVQPQPWADEVERLLGELAEAGKKRARAEEQHRGVEQKLGEIDVDDQLLANSQRIGRLIEATGRFRKDRSDLPKLEVLVKGHQREIDGLLVRLGAEGNDASGLVALTDAQREVIERLASKRAGLETDLNAASRELQELDRNITMSADHLAELHEPPDTGALSRALDTAKTLGPIEEQLGKSVATCEQHQANARGLAQRLGFEDHDLHAVELIAVPMRTRVERERTDRAELLAVRNAISADLGRLDDERHALTEERTRLEIGLELPDQAALESRREHRDSGWGLVRASLEGGVDNASVESWARGTSLPDAYEDAVRGADSVADRRYEHAEQLTTAARITLQLEHVDDQVVECNRKRSQLADRERSLAQAWAEDWAHLGVPTNDPDDALGWLVEHKNLLGVLQADREATNEAARLSHQIATHEDLLRDGLRALGSEPEAGGLSVLIRQSEAVKAEADTQREVRNQATKTLDSYSGQRPNRVGERERAHVAMTQWSTDWAIALEPLGLDGQTTPEAARTTLQLVLDLRKARDDERKDGGRLSGLQADVDTYEADARAAIAELASDLLDSDTADAVSTLNGRLERANKDEVRRQGLDQQAETLAGEIEDARLAHDEASSSLESRRESARLAPDVDLSAVVERSGRVAKIEHDIVDIEGTLIAQGDGKSVDEVWAEAAIYEMDGDRVSADRARVRDELDEVEGELGEAQAVRGQINEQVAQIDGSATAADLDQDAEDALAETAQFLDEYVRVALASALLKRVVSAYGAEHQRPILDDAAQIFRSLTQGAFEDLIVDTEDTKQVLLAKRRNGELLHTPQLSSGTRDQLYLALRLAGVRHQLERFDEPLPLILDDLLVNFDDERTTSTLEVLADIAAETQVLLFTHEASLANLALDTLGPTRCAVVRLSARDHDAPAILAAEVTRSMSRASHSADTDHLDRLLECLRVSPEPLGKAALLEQASLPASAWLSTIKSLIDSGLVQQEGQKRGAKYSLRA